jgi:hypothetical protein
LPTVYGQSKGERVSSNASNPGTVIIRLTAK